MSIVILLSQMTTDPLLNMRADAQRNYKQLVKTAKNIFNAQGAFIPLETIAKQAGVGIGTLYRHFPTRKSLLEAVYADKIANLIENAQAQINSPLSDDALRNWLEMTVEYAANHDGFNDLMELILKDKNSNLISAGSSLLNNAQKSGKLRSDLTIFDLLHLVNGIIIKGNPQKTTKLLSVIMSGLRA